MKDLKVLVIDPDFDYLQLISQFLSGEGFHVITATDGEEGLRKAMIESPDFILMEPMLSKLHGFTLCNIVSKEFKKKIPVIILTNHYQDPHYKKEAIQVYGAAAYLMRPVMKKELRSKIFDVLGKKSMEGMEETPGHQVPEVTAEQAQDEMDEPKQKVVKDAPLEITEENAQALREVTQPENGKERPQEIVGKDEAEEANDSPVEIHTGSSGNNGNGSNGKSKVDKMIDDIESEFGLFNVKKVASSNPNIQV